MSQTTPDIRQTTTQTICPYCFGAVDWAHHPADSEGPAYVIGLCANCGCEWGLNGDMTEPVDPVTVFFGKEMAKLRAENAELLATLANERGEGEAPVEGWRWIPHIRSWQFSTDDLWMDARRDGVRWYWRRRTKQSDWEGSDNTARAAMRAASSQGADVPKEQ